MALSSRAGYVPVIEYCGGTEIGGGYISSTVLRPSVPSMCNQMAFGLDVMIDGVGDGGIGRGEVFLRGPSLGLSSTQLNGDHDAAYYTDTPLLDGIPWRRHGDAIEATQDGYFRVLGRVDDTMNLGGIKVSSTEIERAIVQHPAVREAAAISIHAANGANEQLVVFVVPVTPNADIARVELQSLINSSLNPLFRIAEVRCIEGLPRTASNKVVRQALRKEYFADTSVVNQPGGISRR